MSFRFTLPQRSNLVNRGLILVQGLHPYPNWLPKMIDQPEFFPPKKPIHALVLEDDALIMLDIAEILKSMGIAEVICASSVDQALKSLASGRPDLALIDFQLGTHTATEVAVALQTLDVPFAFVTASMVDHEPLPALTSNLVIMKPFSESDIQNAVRILLACVAAKTG